MRDEHIITCYRRQTDTQTDRQRDKEREREGGRRIDERHHRLRHRLTQTHIGQAGRQIQALRQKRQAGRV